MKLGYNSANISQSQTMVVYLDHIYRTYRLIHPVMSPATSLKAQTAGHWAFESRHPNYTIFFSVVRYMTALCTDWRNPLGVWLTRKTPVSSAVGV